MSTSSFVIGSTVETIQNVNFMAQIQDFGSYICGGTILSSLLILTAAHCALDKCTMNVKPDLEVVVGQLKSGKGKAPFGLQVRQVVRVIQPNPAPWNPSHHHE